MRSVTYANSRVRKDGKEDIKVCMLSKLYLPYFSGAATQAHSLAKSLIERGLQVFVLTGRYPGTLAEEVVEGIPVQRVRVSTSRFPVIRSLSLALSELLALFRYRRRFDIVHVHSVSLFSFLPILLARLLGKKIIVKMTLLGSPSDPATWATSRSGFLMRLAFSLADRVISISAPLSENYNQSGLDASKLRQMPQGVDTSRFSPVTDEEKTTIRERLELRKDATYLSFVGSFKQRKGADILVEAFTALAIDHPNLHLLVIGPDTFDDPVRAGLPYAAFADKLKENIKRSGLAERVIFTGQVDNVEAYLQASDIFVFPSRREGFGTAMTEAMAVGLPCVLAHLDGIAAEINGGAEAALIVDGESPEQYAEQIATLLASPDVALQMGKRGRQRVEEEYAMDSVAVKYIELYRELLSPGAGDG